MIRIYTGEDTQKARHAARRAFDEARSESREAFATRFDDISFDLEKANEALNAESLFGGKNIVFFDGILAHPDGEPFYRNLLKLTEADVYITESDVPKDLLEFFRRVGEIEEFHVLKKTEKKENSFAIADAVGRRDKKAAWVEYERARRRGSSPEEIHGTLFWALKSMIIAGKLSKEEAFKTGMKDYTYRNYSQFAKKYLSGELERKLDRLKEMYHLAHRGEEDLDASLELFLLRL